MKERKSKILQITLRVSKVQGRGVFPISSHCDHFWIYLRNFLWKILLKSSFTFAFCPVSIRHTKEMTHLDVFQISRVIVYPLCLSVKVVTSEVIQNFSSMKFLKQHYFTRFLASRGALIITKMPNEDLIQLLIICFGFMPNFLLIVIHCLP